MRSQVPVRCGSRVFRAGRRVGTTLLLAALPLSVAACGNSGTGGSGGSGGSRISLTASRTATAAADPVRWVSTTPAAKGDVASVDWNLLLEPQSLDPAQSNNYSNEVVANLCEGLQTLQPDFSVTTGLASYHALDGGTRLVYDINPKARFWDGKPVTAQDAVFSLKRVMSGPGQAWWDPAYFSAVKSVSATGRLQMTITLKQPDSLFNELMTTSAGAVQEAAFVNAHHGTVGTPKVGIMCSGPYQYVSWTSGEQIVIARNDHYWRGVTATVKKLTFSFLQGDATESTALLGNAIQGMYNAPYTILQRLAQHGHLYYGKSLLEFYVTPTTKPGPLQNPLIRRALFMALDRAAVAKSAFGGAAVAARTMLPPDAYGGVHASTSPGTGGSSAELAQARKLVRQAGSPKQRIILAMDPGITDSATATMEALAQAGRSIGLNTVFKSVTLGQYYGLFQGGNGWKPVNADGFAEQSYPPVADPLSEYQTLTSPKDPSNINQWSDPAFNRLVAEASAEQNAAKRDGLLAQADAIAYQQMPVIPIVDVSNTVYMGPGLTGAPASFIDFFSPWAASLGASK
jgi:peptide/nickel transport system substrate-binding protein